MKKKYKIPKTEVLEIELSPMMEPSALTKSNNDASVNGDNEYENSLSRRRDIWDD